MKAETYESVLAEIRRGDVAGLMGLPAVSLILHAINDHIHELATSDSSFTVNHTTIDIALALFAGTVWATPVPPGTLYDQATFEQRSAIFVEMAKQSYLSFHTYEAAGQRRM